jgi:hypothetical protein
MLRFLFKFILLPIFVLVAGAGCVAAWLVLTPVDESNVSSRIWQACMVGSGVQTVNNWGRKSLQPVYSSAQCECVAGTVIKNMSAPVAAAGAEGVRAFIKDGITAWLSGDSASLRRASKRDQLAEIFVDSASRMARVCREGKG